MVRYLTLIRFTDQGASQVNESVNRATAFMDQVKNAGGIVLSQYWSVGEYDGCVTFEVPDEKTASALLVGLAKSGNVRTHSLRVYDQTEFEQMLGKIA